MLTKAWIAIIAGIATHSYAEMIANVDNEVHHASSAGHCSSSSTTKSTIIVDCATPTSPTTPTLSEMSSRQSQTESLIDPGHQHTLNRIQLVRPIQLYAEIMNGLKHGIRHAAG